MSDKRDYNIDIGTGDGNNLIDISLGNKFKEIFEKNGIKDVRVDHIFKAANPNTVSSTLHREANVKAIQLEINYALFNEKSDKYAFPNIINSLKEIFLFTLSER